MRFGRTGARRAPVVAPRAAALALTIAALGWLASMGVAAASGPLDLRGELAVVGGVNVVDVDLLPEPTTARPLTIALRLDGTWDLAPGLAARAVLSPTVVLGTPGRDPSEPLLGLGLEDLYLRADLAGGAVEADLGVRRWALGELRLASAVRLDGRNETGTPRGLLGARTTAYLDPWRLRVGLAVPLDDELRPTTWGGALAARWDVATWTLEGHAFVQDRIGGGLTASGTVEDLVVYGDLWLLEDPWELRGGAGVIGYLGDALATLEAAWAPEDGRLDAEPRPAVRAALQASLNRDVGLDALVGVAWPEDPLDPGRREPVVDARLTLSLDTPDAVLSVTPTVRYGLGTLAYGSSVALRAFF